MITFAAWLNIAHAAVMAVLAVHLSKERQDLLIAAAVFGVIGVVLFVLAPAKQPAAQYSGSSLLVVGCEAMRFGILRIA